MISKTQEGQVEVSVVMPAYNSERFIGQSISGILNQDLGNFELIVVDDGSCDGTAQIVRGFQDSRVRLLTNEKNFGVAHSLNRGFNAARGKYLARLDSDDLPLPRRLSLQVAFLESHPEISVVGSWVQRFGLESGLVRYPATPSRFFLALLHRNPIAHSSVMMRSELVRSLKAGSLYEGGVAQDYDLWTRMSPEVKFANIPEVLVLQRQHANQVTRHKFEQYQPAIEKIQKAFHTRLGLRENNISHLSALWWWEAYVSLRHRADFTHSEFLAEVLCFFEIEARRCLGTRFGQTKVYRAIRRLVKKPGLDHPGLIAQERTRTGEEGIQRSRVLRNIVGDKSWF